MEMMIILLLVLQIGNSEASRLTPAENAKMRETCGYTLVHGHPAPGTQNVSFPPNWKDIRMFRREPFVPFLASIYQEKTGDLSTATLISPRHMLTHSNMLARNVFRDHKCDSLGNYEYSELDLQGLVIMEDHSGQKYRKSYSPVIGISRAFGIGQCQNRDAITYVILELERDLTIEEGYLPICIAKQINTGWTKYYGLNPAIWTHTGFKPVVEKACDVEGYRTKCFKPSRHGLCRGQYGGALVEDNWVDRMVLYGVNVPYDYRKEDVEKCLSKYEVFPDLHIVPLGEDEHTICTYTGVCPFS